MFILEDRPPMPCPSMNPEDLKLYVLYKCLPKGTELTNSSGVPIRNTEGDPITALGGWKAPVNADQMLSAVRVLHEFYGNTGQFEVKYF